MTIAALARPFALPRRPTRVVERNLMFYRRTSMVIISGFFEPLFYLFSMGFGVGSLIGAVALDNGLLVPYAAYVAPALLASSSMNGAIYEVSNNFFEKLKYSKIYEAVVATPMSLADIAAGEVLWALMRGALYSVGFVAVVGLLGVLGTPLMTSWLGLLAFPASTLIGFAFAGAGLAATTYVRRWQDFDYMQLAIMPMFLFSGTFYPISAYPLPVQLFVEVTPLYRGVHMLRELTTGTVDALLIVDVVYLLAVGLIGLWITSKRLAKLLTS
jgi:lipooligosaccharide transport system permease protein